MALDFYIIGKRIKQARKNKKLTQENLVEQMGVSIAYLSKVETGKIHINLERLSQICNILGITEGEILNGVSINSTEYLNYELYELVNNCPPNKLKLFYNLLKVICEDKNI